MQATDLKFPGGYTHAKTIRREVAHVISQLEIAAATSTVDGDFAAFLSDAAAKTPGFVGPTLPATQAIVSNGGSVTVQNSAGVLSSTGTATVAGGSITSVRLGATKTILTSGTKINAVAVSGTGNFATPTIVNGVITAIVLSAS